MKMSTVDSESNANENETRSRRLILLVLLLSALFWAGGCEGYYTAYPGYGPNYGYGPGPYYGGGSVVVAVGDRPYYGRGPGYWSGRAYYVWRPGHGESIRPESLDSRPLRRARILSRVLFSVAATSAGYQAVTSPPAKPREAPTSISRRSWRLR